MSYGIFSPVTVQNLGSNPTSMICSFSIPAWKLYAFEILGPQFPAPLQSQESLRPFPWSRSSSTVPDCRLQAEPGQGHDGQGADVLETSTPVLAANRATLDSEQQVSTSTELPRLKLDGEDSAFNVGRPSFCDSLEFLDYKLPPPGVSAGRVLQHAKSVLSTLIQKEQPCIFKVGYTHNPEFRWANPLYGYQVDPHYKWSKMLVLFESTEVAGPAMLEAALIELFRSTLCNLRY
eukprot:s1020_g10.t1